jgi:hypothetical protein
MGEGTDVTSPAMRAYEQKADGAGTRIGGIQLADSFGKVGSAMPGGAAGGAASGCALTRDVPEWGKAISAQGHKVGSANNSYTANELSTSDKFAGMTTRGSATASGGN